jgi:hypothetical protein
MAYDPEGLIDYSFYDSANTSTHVVYVYVQVVPRWHSEDTHTREQYTDTACARGRHYTSTR